MKKPMGQTAQETQTEDFFLDFDKTVQETVPFVFVRRMPLRMIVSTFNNKVKTFRQMNE